MALAPLKMKIAYYLKRATLTSIYLDNNSLIMAAIMLSVLKGIHPSASCSGADINP
jgi:hypothetical protein